MTRLLLPLLFLPLLAFSQRPAAAPAAPQLIIGIVVDQMRYDFLYRYRDSYGPDGFKRLLRDGFSCENTHYNYMPTFTAPGHAAIYTGTTPSINGIIANEWWDPQWGKHRYVTTDTTVRSIGGTARAGQHSPRVLLASTITDELRLFSNLRSKVVGVALKDRSSILPAGHLPNGCYWFDDKTGNWITSSYYPDSVALPDWVQAFNVRKLPDSYLAKPWTRLAGVLHDQNFAGWERYDRAAYINLHGGLPYDLPALKNKLGYSVLRFTPFGNSLTLDFALEAIERHELGADNVPDFLCLSFSSTDYVGHQFGIHAEETEDTYLRLDQDIARLLAYIDRKFGRENVLVFLTADHGAAETPAHMEDVDVPAGVFRESRQDSILEAVLAQAVGVKNNFVYEVGNQQVWLNREALRGANVPFDFAAELVAAYLRQQPGVYDAYTRAQLATLSSDFAYIPEIRRGLHPRRSGDVLFNLDPAWHPDDAAFFFGGTTHGSPYAYDTHVPLVWYGWNVRSGEHHDPVNITDIAPTLAAWLRIMEPNGSTGKVIRFR